MRFGIPLGQNVAVLSKPALKTNLSENGDKVAHKLLLESSAQSASQLLNESLIKLDALSISNFSSSKKEKCQEWEAYLDKTRKSVDTSMSFLDEEFERSIRSSQSDVKRIIENQIRLREEEKQRLLALEREKQRKEKEEAERKKREEEEAKRKLEEEKKLAEEKRIAEEKRLAEEQKRRKEKEQKEQEEKKKKEELKKKAEKEAAAKISSAFASPLQVEKTLLKYRQDIQDIKTHIVSELDKDKPLKKDVGVIKRKVNVKLGQLSNSHKQLEIVTSDVIDLIQPLSTQPLAYKWLLNFLSKAIVSQAETEVTVKPAAALPLGRLTYNLLCNLDGLEYYLSARFVKKCCLIIGYTGTIDTEEGRVRMGWRRSDGKWETEVKYEERMGGILSVWAVIGWENQTSNFSLFNMKAEWAFLARLLNTKQELLGDVHFVAICNWWEAAAAKFYKVYGKQAAKLLTVAATEWAAAGIRKGFPAATRLQILGEDLLKKSNFNSLKEMER